MAKLSQFVSVEMVLLGAHMLTAQLLTCAARAPQHRLCHS
jgi:hypothetical protein